MNLGTTHEKGAALTTTLIFLFVIMGLLVASSQSSNLQLKMGHNLSDRTWAFEAAEAAIKEAEEWIMALNTVPDEETSCTSQPCVLEEQTWVPEEQTHSWWTSDANTAPYSGTLNSVNTQPRYVIEYIKFVPDEKSLGSNPPPGTYFYRVTARGTGGTDNAAAIIQTTVARRF